MSYVYRPGTVRWKRHTGPGDVRGTRPPKGWEREAVLLDEHPVTRKRFKQVQWWFRDTYEGN